MWEEALQIQASPSTTDLDALVSKSQSLSIQVRFADWTGANKYGDSLIGIIWISPVVSQIIIIFFSLHLSGSIVYMLVFSLLPLPKKLSQ